MRKQHIKQVTLINDQERSGGVMKRRGLELCTKYCKIQIPRRLTSRCLEVGLNIYLRFGLDDEWEEKSNKDLHWCSGIEERVCDRTWIKPGKRRQCYK